MGAGRIGLVLLLAGLAVCSAAKDRCRRYRPLYHQIAADLAPYQNGTSHYALWDRALRLLRHDAIGFAHIDIDDDGVVWLARHSYKQLPVPKKFSHITSRETDDFIDVAEREWHLVWLLEIYELSLRFKLPPSHFWLSTTDMDWVARTPGLPDQQLPVFSYSGKKNSAVIRIPASPYMRCFNDAATDSLLRQMPAIMKKHPWAKRRPQVISRYSMFCHKHYGQWPDGTPRPCARKELVKLFPAVTDLVNITYIRNGSDRARLVLPQDHAAHKYIAVNDGYAYSTKMEKMMALGSTILVQDSPFYSYYHHLLKPWVHYVPYWKTHPLDILDALKVLVANDTLAQSIGTAGQHFSRRYHNRHARLCYFREVLHRYSKLLPQSSYSGRRACRGETLAYTPPGSTPQQPGSSGWCVRLGDVLHMLAVDARVKRGTCHHDWRKQLTEMEVRYAGGPKLRDGE